MRKIYISGCMTVVGMEQAKIDFDRAQDRLEYRGWWHTEIINPDARGIIEGWEWIDYMVDDLKCISTCTHMYMISGWERSPGAKIEHACATRMGLTIMYED